MSTIALFITSFITSLVAVGSARKLALHYQIGALPSARKIHSGFKPLLGGLGIFLGLIIGMLTANYLRILPTEIWQEQRFFWAGLLIILLTGFVDDLRGLNAWQKFSGQFLAAFLAAKGGCSIEALYSPGGAVLSLGDFALPFSILWIMFVMNAVNLLDGLDGLSAGIALITTLGFLALAILQGDVFLIVLTVSLIGGLAGFLKFNYHPASIFMGDVGSLMLGYLLACFSVESLKIANSHQVYFLASLVFLGTPVTDTLISFFRRMGRGDHPFKADREHIHHRLLKLGLSHLDSVWLMYYFTLFYVILGVLMVLYRELAGIPLFILAFTFSIFWTWRLGYVETRRYISFGKEESPELTAARPPIHVDRIWHQIAIFFGDVLSINVAMYLAYWFKFQSGILNPLNFRAIQDYLTEPVWLVMTGLWLLLFWLNGLYRMTWDTSRFVQLLRISRVIVFGILVIFMLVNLDIALSDNTPEMFNRNQLSTLGFYAAAMLVFVNAMRLLIIYLEKRFHWFLYTYKNTLLIGATRKARNIIRDIRGNPHLLNNIVAVVDRKYKAPAFEGIPVINDHPNLPQLIHEHRIEEIIVAISEAAKEDFLNIVATCDRMQVVVKTLPELQTVVSGRTPELAGSNLVRAFPENMVLWQWGVKRLLDVSFAASMLLLLVPLWAPLSVIIWWRLGGFPLAKLPALGRNGRLFNMRLFPVDREQAQLQACYAGSRQEDRLTPLGNFLYRTQLYKLPLLLNILSGDMSLVGPRPESPEWYRQHQGRLRFLHRRLMVRPGITGLAQVKYRFESSQTELTERLKYDIYYSETISLSLDVRIMLRSFLLLMKKLH